MRVGHLLSFKRVIKAAASAGEGESGRSAGLWKLWEVEELVLVGVAGREEDGEPTTDGGYQDCAGPWATSCGPGCPCCSWEPLYENNNNKKI